MKLDINHIGRRRRQEMFVEAENQSLKYNFSDFLMAT